jgi:anion-transporting  ArsA/GET3 family ATPase
MSDIERRFLFVTGKGGVGKTTVSVALARTLAAAGKRVLLAVTEPGLVPEQLGIAGIDTDVKLVAPGLSVVHVESEAALREYGSMMLRSKTAYRALFENRYAKSFLSAVPGLYQWATLGKAWFHSQETLPSGTRRFDTVVFDAPATGHGLEMLRVPKVITAAATPGPLRRDAERAWNTLTDTQQCGILLVTLPEESPVQETFDLLKELGELGLSASRVVLNAIAPAIFSAEDAVKLSQLDKSALSPAAQAFVQVGVERMQLERLHRAQHARVLEATSVDVTALPWVSDAARPSGIATLSRALAPLLSHGS